MKITRKKALAIAEAACRAYERDRHVPGGTTLLLPEDYATSGAGFRYAAVNRPDGTFVRVLVDEPFVGLPYHCSPKGSKTWLGLRGDATSKEKR